MSNTKNMKTNNRPEITDRKIEEITRLLEENPGIGRTRLSVMLCEMWNWRGLNGQVKDMSCRDMLLALDKAGKIILPEPQSKNKAAGPSTVKHEVHDETPVIGDLKDVRPLRVERVSSKADLAQFKSYIDQYHYLGFDRFIGERMAYTVYSCDGRALACLLFGSAAWSCRDRDQTIGWNKEQRKSRLNLLTNNVRFLIYPWVTIPHLASHVLSLIAKRISGDWESKYGHPVVLLETFVERRFKGTCYKAANWIHIGSTTGRGRDGGHHNAILPVKEIYLYPLQSTYRAVLSRNETDS